MIVYALRHGAGPPLNWGGALDRIVAAKVSLWNDLVNSFTQELEEERHLVGCAADERLVGLWSTASAASRALREAKDKRSELRRRARQKVATPDLDAEIARLVRERRDAQRAASEMERRLRRSSGVGGRLSALRTEARAERRCIACGRDRRYPELGPGDSNDCFRSFEEAVAAFRKGRRQRPKHHNEGDDVSLYVQLAAQNVGGERVVEPGRRRAKIVGGELRGWTWADLTSGRRRKAAVIHPYDVGLRNPEKWALLRLCVSSAATLEIPFRVHRLPPPGSMLKGVRVVRRRHTGRPPGSYEWSVVWTVAAQDKDVRGGREDYLRIWGGVNWRITEQGIRVLEAVAEDGTHITVALPLRWLEEIRRLDALERGLGQAREAAREKLSKALELSQDYIPLEDQERISDAVRKDAPREALLRVAESAVVGLDGETVCTLRRWARGTVGGPAVRRAILDLHHRGLDRDAEAAELAALLGERRGAQHAADLRRKFTRRRRDLYRRAARWLALNCSSLVMADLDGSQLQRPRGLPRGARRLRAALAPFELLQDMRWQARKHDAEFVDADCAWASRTCPVHPHIDTFKDVRDSALEGRCEECGCAWDRDRALALNLLRNDSPHEFARWLTVHHPERFSTVDVVGEISTQGKQVNQRSGLRLRRVHENSTEMGIASGAA